MKKLAEKNYLIDLMNQALSAANAADKEDEFYKLFAEAKKSGMSNKAAVDKAVKELGLTLPEVDRNYPDAEYKRPQGLKEVEQEELPLAAHVRVAGEEISKAQKTKNTIMTVLTKKYPNADEQEIKKMYMDFIKKNIGKYAGVKKTDKEYDMQDIERHMKEMDDVKKAPLSDRQENAKEWYKDISTNPELIAERISWLLMGNYGRGAMLKAEQIMSMTHRANKVAALCILIAGTEWRLPPQAAINMWKKLTPEQQRALQLAVGNAINDYLVEKEGRKSASVKKAGTKPLPQLEDTIYQKKIDVKGKGRVGVFDQTAASHIGGKVLAKLFEAYGWTKEDHLAAAGNYRIQLVAATKAKEWEKVHKLTALALAHAAAAKLVKNPKKEEKIAARSLKNSVSEKLNLIAALVKKAETPEEKANRYNKEYLEIFESLGIKDPKVAEYVKWVTVGHIGEKPSTKLHELQQKRADEYLKLFMQKVYELKD